MANILTLLFDGKEYPIPAIEGKTPVKGEDYFTQEDIQEIIAAVIRELPKYNGEASENYVSLTIDGGGLISDKVIHYEIGMTWGDFVSSKYNTDNFFGVESGFITVVGSYVLSEKYSGYVIPTAHIDLSREYVIQY